MYSHPRTYSPQLFINRSLVRFGLPWQLGTDHWRISFFPVLYRFREAPYGALLSLAVNPIFFFGFASMTINCLIASKTI